MSVEHGLPTLLARHSPAMQDLAQSLRERIHAAQPGLAEDVSLKLGVLYFKHQGVVCALSLHKAHVNLHFYKGVELTDPQGVLQGGGKRLRHLKFTRLEDHDPTVLAGLVREAYLRNTL